MTYLNLFSIINNSKVVRINSNYENAVNYSILTENGHINGAGSDTVISSRNNNIAKRSIMTPVSVISIILVLSTLPSLISGQKSNFLSSSNFFRREMSPYKGFSGVRVRPDSLPLVYVHDQTVAVVEVGDNRELYNCELIEIYKANQGKELLNDLSSRVAQPVKINFDQMMELMDNCQLLETPPIVKSKSGNESGGSGRGFSSTTQSSILSGIIPGTKWCGAGDLADTFFDLGREENLDRCCRNHDICPSKVRPSTTRYNLTNSAIFTKSHCTCDHKFLHCLKSIGSPTADIMGNFYFNLLRVPCLNITGHRFQTAFRY